MNSIKKFIRQQKGKRELKRYEKMYSLRLNELETKISEVKIMLETLGDHVSNTILDELNAKIELLRQLQKLERTEYVAVRSAVKALYGVE